ncbi:hypothetical protein [uncultured Maribacter sp.]|uniref:hypothetical protein n=1 Tax=uncultured Maribacter sp. TaxID=431308 RepID=UPI00260F5670|nr:hypothetical protein [uncultured Maribacter sp.]
MVGFIKSRLALIPIALFYFVFVSCESKDDSVEPAKVIDIEGITRVLTQDTWQVESYSKATIDETVNYANYIFTFNANGTVGVVNGSVSVSGAWVLSNPEYNLIRLELFFSTPEELAELANDWEIDDYSNVTINLENNSSIGETEILSFRKN